MSPRLPPVMLVGAAALLACSGERWVIGEAASAGPDAAATFDAALGASCRGEVEQGITEEGTGSPFAPSLLGSWLATLSGSEAEAFPAARAQLRLTRESASLSFDGGSPAPPLLDPAAGYLCTTSVESCASEAGFVAGFAYRLVQPSARGSITSFGLFLDEPWDEWCRQQLPVERTQPGCAPRHEVEPAYDEARWTEGCAVRRGDEWTPLPCDRLATVERQVCACTADGCRARARVLPVHLRLVEQNQLEGALWFTAERAQVLLFQRE